MDKILFVPRFYSECGHLGIWGRCGGKLMAPAELSAYQRAADLLKELYNV